MVKVQEHVAALKSVKDRAKEAENIMRTIPEKVNLYELKAFEKHLKPAAEKGKEFDPDKWNWNLLDASKEGYLGDKIAEDIISNYKQDIDATFKDTAAKRIKKGFLDSNYGVSVEMYKDLFEQAGKDYKETKFYKEKLEQAQNSLANQMFYHQLEPLKVEHIDNILKEIEADKYLMSVKDRKGTRKRDFLPDLLTLIRKYDKEKGKMVDAETISKTKFGNYLKPEYQSSLGLKYDRPDATPMKKAA